MGVEQFTPACDCAIGIVYNAPPTDWARNYQGEIVGPPKCWLCGRMWVRVTRIEEICA